MILSKGTFWSKKLLNENSNYSETAKKDQRDSLIPPDTELSDNLLEDIEESPIKLRWHNIFVPFLTFLSICERLFGCFKTTKAQVKSTQS